MYNLTRKVFNNKPEDTMVYYPETHINNSTGSSISMPDIAVNQYLVEFPDILPVVKKLSALAVKTFSKSSTLTLELYQDPEIDDRYLTLYVRQQHYDKSIRNQLNAITEAISEDLCNTSGWIIITTDYQPPRI